MNQAIILFCTILLLASCGDDSSSKKKPSSTVKKEKTEKKVEKKDLGPASTRIDLDNKGVGPIKSLELSEEIDTELAAKGEEIYKQMCTACHKTDSKFIGPAPKDILKRRSPEWVMNMILVPEKMVKEDPLAKDLLKEFNGSPMANQGLDEDQARAILEFFRTL